MISGYSLDEATVRYNEIIRQVAREEDIHLVDIEPAYNRASDEELTRWLLPDPDILHLSEEGNEIYFKAFLPKFKEVLLKRIELLSLIHI